MRISSFSSILEDGNDQYSQADLDNHSGNLNPDHDQYYGSRDIDRPDQK